MPAKRITSLVLFLVVFAASGGYAQLLPPIIRNITPSEYQGHYQVFDAVEDDRGYMYFGSPNGDAGIIEHDGSSWNLMTTSKQSVVTCLAKDSLGRIYVGGVSEMGYLAPNSLGEMEFVSINYLLPEEYREFGTLWNVNALSSGVFFQSHENVYRYYKDSITVFEPEVGFHLAFQSSDEYYVTTKGKKLLKFSGDSLQEVDDGTWFRENQSTLRGLVSMDENAYVAAAINLGLLKYNPNSTDNKWEIWDIPARKRIAASIPKGLIKLQDGGYAIYTIQNGVFVLNKDGSLRFHINELNGLQHATVWGAYEDSHQNIWLSLQDGITVFHASGQVRTFGVQNDWENSILDVHWYKGEMYVGGGSGVHKINTIAQDSFESRTYKGSYIVPEEISSGFCYKLMTFGDELMIAGAGVLVSDGQSIQLVTGGNDHTFLLHSKKIPDVVFTGGQEGLGAFALRKEGEKWNNLVDSTEGSRYSFFDDVVEWEVDDEYVEMWGGTTDKKVVRYRFWEDKLNYPEKTAFDSLSGLPFAEYNVFKLEGEVVFGCKYGLFRFDRATEKFFKDERFAPSQTNGLTTTDVFRLRELKNGDVWLNGTGLWWYGKKTADGFQWNNNAVKNPDQGSAKCIIEDPNGGVWLGSTAGMVYVDHTVNRSYDLPFNAHITMVNLLGNDSTLFAGSFADVAGRPTTSQPSGSVPTIEFEDNAMRFRFASTFYEHVDSIRYSYLLEGFDDNWSTWGSEQLKEYTNIPEGEYTFKVKARNVYGVESEVASYKFILLPPWYRTVWAYLGYALCALILMYIVLKLNSRRLKAANLRLQLLIDKKTAEVRDQKDKIEAQRDDIAKKNKSLTDSIKYAKSLQEAILPASELIAKSFDTHMVFFRPRDIVSGDFYWFHDQGDIAFFAAVDCTGHGVPGALVSMTGSNLLQNIIVERDIHIPGTILHELNIGVKQVFKRDGSLASANDGMDLSLVAVDKKTKLIKFAGAHNSMVVIRDGEILETKGDRTPIGGRTKPDYEFKTHEFQGQEGDMVYMYSDGYPDQFGGPENRKFMSSRFKKMLAEIYTLPPKEQVERLELNLEIWQGKRSRIDDILVVGFRL